MLFRSLVRERREEKRTHEELHSLCGVGEGVIDDCEGRDELATLRLSEGENAPVCPAAIRAFLVFSIARKYGGMGLHTPSSAMNAKQSFAPAPPCSPSWYASSFHGSRSAVGSYSQGLDSATAFMKILSALTDDEIGPRTEGIASCPYIELALPESGWKLFSTEEKV